MINKEATDRLELIFAIADNDEPKQAEGEDEATFPKIMRLATEALEILKEQPPASEFTERFRLLLANQDKTVIVQDAYEACKIIDASEASRKELKELLTEYGRHSPGCSQEFGKKYRCRCGWSEVEANEQGD